MRLKVVGRGHESEALSDRSLGKLPRIADAIAVVHGFVGVEPEAVEGNSCLEIVQVTLPPRAGLVLEEVREHDVICPAVANEV